MPQPGSGLQSPCHQHSHRSRNVPGDPYGAVGTPKCHPGLGGSRAGDTSAGPMPAAPVGTSHGSRFPHPCPHGAAPPLPVRACGSSRAPAGSSPAKHSQLRLFGASHLGRAWSQGSCRERSPLGAMSSSSGIWCLVESVLRVLVMGTRGSWRCHWLGGCSVVPSAWHREEQHPRHLPCVSVVLQRVSAPLCLPRGWGN